MRTDELKVYRDTYEFTRLVMKELKNFPRFERLKKRFRIRNEFIHGLVLPDMTI